MNKRKQQIAQPDDAKKIQSDQPTTALSGKRFFLRLVWVLALCLFAVIWTVLGLFPDKTSWIDSDGLVHEPLIGLIPLSFFFLVLGLVLAVFDMALKSGKRH